MSKTGQHILTGKTGENLARKYLEDGNFEIMDTNWRVHRCEVDIIATKEDIVHFIEVKTRTSLQYGYPENAVSTGKMQCLKTAAAAWQLQHPEWTKVQFDVIAIQLKNGQVTDLHINWDVYF